MTREEKQQLVLDILENFKKELKTYRFLKKCDQNDHSIASESCLRVAIIDWLKVFGSKNNSVFFNRFVEKRKFFDELAALSSESGRRLGDKEHFKEIVEAVREFRNIPLPGKGDYEYVLRYTEDAVKIAEAFERTLEKMDL